MALADMIYLMVMLFVLFIVFYVLTNLHSSLQPTLQILKNNQTEEVIQHFTNLQSTYPYWFLLLWFGLLITSIVSAFFVQSHPIFIIFAIVISFINVIISYVFQDILNKLIITSIPFQEFISTNVILNFISQNLCLVSSVVIFLITLVIVIKNMVVVE